MITYTCKNVHCVKGEEKVAKRDRDFELDDKPISSWGYVGLMILYTIPVLGIIMLFLHAFRPKNINVRNFARSYFIQFIIVFVMYVVLIVLALVGIVDESFYTEINPFPEHEVEAFSRIFHSM